MMEKMIQLLQRVYIPEKVQHLPNPSMTHNIHTDK